MMKHGKLVGNIIVALVLFFGFWLLAFGLRIIMEKDIPEEMNLNGIEVKKILQNNWTPWCFADSTALNILQPSLGLPQREG